MPDEGEPSGQKHLYKIDFLAKVCYFSTIYDNYVIIRIPLQVLAPSSS